MTQTERERERESKRERVRERERERERERQRDRERERETERKITGATIICLHYMLINCDQIQLSSRRTKLSIGGLEGNGRWGRKNSNQVEL